MFTKSMNSISISLALLLFITTQALSFQLFSGATPERMVQILDGKEAVCVVFDEYLKIHVIELPSLKNYLLTTSPRKMYNPRISPDGNWVMYELYPQASDKGNPIAIHRIAEGSTEQYILGDGMVEPEWWVDPVSKDTFVVYSTANDQSVIDVSGTKTTYNGVTERREFSGHQFVGEKEQLFNQGFKAGLSKDGRWLGTANKTVFLYDMQEKSLHRIRSSSTCYERMNPTNIVSKMNQICFINTSHDTLLTRDSRDSTVWFLTFPAQWAVLADATRQWQSNGWSNHEEYMLTGYRKNLVQHLALVKRSTKELFPLCQGGPHQDMWIKDAPLYDPAVQTKRSLSLHSSTGIERKAQTLTMRFIDADFFSPSQQFFSIQGTKIANPAAAGIVIRKQMTETR